MKLRHTQTRRTQSVTVNTLGAVLAGATLIAAAGCSRSGVNLFDDDVTEPADDTGGDARNDTNADADFDADFDTRFDTDFDTPPDTRRDPVDPDTNFDVPPDNVCGDGSIGGNEQCDDGNRRNGDGCDRQCRRETMPDGMCLGDPDREIVESGFAGDVTGECFEQCYFGGNDIDVDCTTDCMADATGMSFGCAECYGLVVECIVIECLEICQLDEQECEACQSERCLPEFASCSGLGSPSPPDSVCGDGRVDRNEECDDGNRRNGDGCDRSCRSEDPPPLGLCVGAEDRDIVESGIAEDAGRECFLNCGGPNEMDRLCADNCMRDLTGMSAQCASCYGEFLECVVIECSESCQFDDLECDSCWNQNCLTPYQRCSGLGTP